MAKFTGDLVIPAGGRRKWRRHEGESPPKRTGGLVIPGSGRHASETPGEVVRHAAIPRLVEPARAFAAGLVRAEGRHAWARTTWTPAAIAGLKLWVDATKITGLADGAGVTTWSDLSGNGNHLTQATALLQPLYKVNIQNGKPAVFWNDAVNKPVLSTTTAAYAQPNTIFVVGAVTGAANNAILDGITTRTIFFINGWTRSLYAGNTVTAGTYTSGTWEVWSLVVNGASSAIYVNGSSSGAVDAGAAGLRDVKLGINTENNAPLLGYIGEVLIYNALLSTANRQRVESYLKAKWGTP